jgi:hypothetical protein
VSVWVQNQCCIIVTTKFLYVFNWLYMGDYVFDTAVSDINETNAVLLIAYKQAC